MKKENVAATKFWFSKQTLFEIDLLIETDADWRIFILQVAIAVGDSINGLHYIYGGMVHSMESQWSNISFFAHHYQNKTRFDCAMKIYPAFDVFGTLFASLSCLLLSIERCLAVSFPLFYSCKYTGKVRAMGVSLCVLLSLVSVGFMYLSAHSENTGNFRIMCYLGLSAGVAYKTFHQSSVIVLQCVSFCLSVVAYLEAGKVALAASRVSERRDVRPILAVNALSVLLVSVPLFCRLATWTLKWKIVSNQRQIVMLMMIVPTVNCFVNLGIYMLVSKDFRSHALCLLTFGRYKGGSNHVKVGPVFQLAARVRINHGAMGRRNFARQSVIAL